MKTNLSIDTRIKDMDQQKAQLVIFLHGTVFSLPPRMLQNIVVQAWTRMPKNYCEIKACLLLPMNCSRVSIKEALLLREQENHYDACPPQNKT